MRKTILTAAAMISAAIVLSSGIAAAARTVSAALTFRDITVTMDGRPLEILDAYGNVTEPFIYNDTAYLPIRAIAEAVGLNVRWDGENNAIHFTHGDGAGASTQKSGDAQAQAQNGGPQEAKVTMYALDGRTLGVSSSEIAAYQDVGWYLYADYVYALADSYVKKGDYEYAAEIYETESRKNKEFAEAFYRAKGKVLDQWKKKTGSCPAAILGYEMDSNSIGIPEVSFCVRNLTDKEIARVDIHWVCYDAYGNRTADYSWYDGSYDGWTSYGEGIAPYDYEWYTWTLYSHEETATVRNYYVSAVAFADGTSWSR